ncbi:MAG: hypothetical protein ISP91_05480 [Pseudomonadales bacterium]|nr:hypothetical protein [Pseudomonadales bacterium]
MGEVWFASGQSNMVFAMDRVAKYRNLISETRFPNIRLFTAPMVTSVVPILDSAGMWSDCNAETAGQCSAVAFFFAKSLNEQLEVPIGIIVSAWGGKPIEAFTSRSALKTLEDTSMLVEASEIADRHYEPVTAKMKYEKELARWRSRFEGQPSAPRPPDPPQRPLERANGPGVLFNSMINPFVGYSIQGVIWYQGEANAKTGETPYDLTLPLLIQDWRDRWQHQLSFYFVQLANFREPVSLPGSEDPWPLLQDRMRRVLDKVPGTEENLHISNSRDPTRSGTGLMPKSWTSIRWKFAPKRFLHR